MIVDGGRWDIWWRDVVVYLVVDGVWRWALVCFMLYFSDNSLFISIIIVGS